MLVCIDGQTQWLTYLAMAADVPLQIDWHHVMEGAALDAVLVDCCNLIGEHMGVARLDRSSKDNEEPMMEERLFHSAADKDRVSDRHLVEQRDQNSHCWFALVERLLLLALHMASVVSMPIRQHRSCCRVIEIDHVFENVLAIAVLP